MVSVLGAVVAAAGAVVTALGAVVSVAGADVPAPPPAVVAVPAVPPPQATRNIAITATTNSHRGAHLGLVMFIGISGRCRVPRHHPLYPATVGRPK